jgi:hypothetical protein
MSWRDIVRKGNCGMEKGNCRCASCEKQEFEKKLVGNQKKIDANKDGKITGEDFAMLNETKKAKMECPKCKGKGCEHCKNKGYHSKPKPRGAFTDQE